METGVSTFVDETGWGRTRCSVLMFVIMLVVGSASALGFGVWSFVAPFGMSILDFFDFLTNSVMMPIAAFCTCFLIVKVVGVNRIVEHVRKMCIRDRYTGARSPEGISTSAPLIPSI